MVAEDFISGVLARIVERLEQAEIPYMLVGSMAAFLYGEPRTTRDIDIVIAPGNEGLDRLLQLLPEEDYYVDRAAAFDALRRRSMFNVIDNKEAWKVDLIVRKDDAYGRASFDNRREERFLHVPVIAQGPEDLVISKLAWSKRSGGSDQQERDIAGVLAVSGNRMDYEYIERWAQRLGLEELWEKLHDKSKARPTGS